MYVVNHTRMRSQSGYRGLLPQQQEVFRADNYTVRTAPAVLGYGSAMAVLLSTFTFTGGQLQGYKRDPEVDELARKEHMRKNRRRPIDETLHELGEGRGRRGIMGQNLANDRLTCVSQEFMDLAIQNEEHRGLKRHMGSMCQFPARRMIELDGVEKGCGGVYVCISLTEQIPRMKFDFSTLRRRRLAVVC